MPGDFTHLHLHTLYSLLDGAIRLPDLMSSCAETGMKSVAVTDHGNMFGVVNFYQEAKKHGIKPVIGFEAYVAGDKGMQNREQRIGHHLVLLAQNDVGYRNLRYLSTKAFTEGFYYDPRVDKQILKTHSEGVIALTACMAGAVPKAIRRGDMDEARKEVRDLKSIFGDRLYVELQRHGLPQERAVEPALLGLAYDLDLPIVATNEPYFASPEDFEAHDALLSIAEGSYVAVDDRRIVGAVGPLGILLDATGTRTQPPQYFAVHPDYRHRGHGRALWRAAIAWGAENGARYKVLQAVSGSASELFYMSEGLATLGFVCSRDLPLHSGV